MKILTADDLDAVLSLVGQQGRDATPLNVELAGSRRVDLLARTRDGLVHVEFVKDKPTNFDSRMVEYWARICRRESTKAVRQFVLVLGDGVLVPDRCLDETGRLVLGSSRSLLDAATTPASSVLSRSSTDVALRGVDMPIAIRDTPLGRELMEAGRQEGRQQGRHAGRQEGERAAILRLTRLMLQQRLGDDPAVSDLAERLAELPDEERLRRIAEATPDDLRG